MVDRCVRRVTGFYINCGADKEVQVGSIKWVPDAGFIAVGNASAVDKPAILPVLATLRHFPDATARKYCYTVPAVKGSRRPETKQAAARGEGGRREAMGRGGRAWAQRAVRSAGAVATGVRRWLAAGICPARLQTCPAVREVEN